MLSVLMVTFTDDLVTSLSSKTILPSKEVNRPTTVLTPAWGTAKFTEEWFGSILNSSAAKAAPYRDKTAKVRPRNLRISVSVSLSRVACRAGKTAHDTRFVNSYSRFTHLSGINRVYSCRNDAHA